MGTRFLEGGHADIEGHQAASRFWSDASIAFLSGVSSYIADADIDISLKVMDFSPIVAWSVPFAGVVLAGLFGASRAKSGAKSIWGAAFLTALGIGFALMFVQVALHSACVEVKGCVNRGDVNMSYWFQSFFSIPIYWLVAGSVWQMKQ